MQTTQDVMNDYERAQQTLFQEDVMRRMRMILILMTMTTTTTTTKARMRMLRITMTAAV